MARKQLLFSTSSTGTGEIANSNKRFKRKVQVLTVKSKSMIAREKLEALFNPINHERIPSNNHC